MIVGYTPREYHVVKVRAGSRRYHMVLAADIDDPDVWTLVNVCDTAAEAWRYVAEVQHRARKMVEAV